jgi:DNA-binding NtrC family response regulator
MREERIPTAYVRPAALRRSSEMRRVDALEAAPIAGLVVESAAMLTAVGTLQRIAPSNASVLLQGETGTGKEVLARAIHELSDRRDQPFEVIDCGSMSPTLVASELFGHERGAFTGAHGERPGVFERAHQGTVFLDEIGELPLDLQPTLLGVLERRRFRRLGGTRERSIDVRVVSATHRDLRAEAHSGNFRPDLYFRLAVTRIMVPPLRERRADVLPLIEHFAQQLTGDPQLHPFDSEALAALETHRWPGNVRELRNLVESALATGTVALDDWEYAPSGLHPTGASSAPSSPMLGEPSLPLLPFREARARANHVFERQYVTTLIQTCGGNASEASRRAQMDRPYLLSLLRKHGLR